MIQVITCPVYFLFKCVNLQSTNHMNSSLLSLYKKGNPDSVPPTPKNDPVETPPPSRTAPQTSTLTPEARGERRISDGGWFIDKTPDGKDFFIDLSEDGEEEEKKLISEVLCVAQIHSVFSRCMNRIGPFQARLCKR